MAPGEYRQNAASCMNMAEQLPDGDWSKPFLIEMATAWLQLAEQTEKNLTTDLVYETPPPRSRATTTGRPAAATDSTQSRR
jgi:hypothetical protein